MATNRVATRSTRRNTDYIRFPFLVSYRRQFWSLDTCSRFRRFATVDEARAFVARTSRRKGSKGGTLCASLEERGPDGRWRAVPLDAQGVR